jgi:hypothetical protein
VFLVISTTSGSLTLQLSGTLSSGSTVAPIDLDGGTNSNALASTTNANLDVIARDSTVGKFARIDLHGSFGSTCKFWGMFTLSG